MLTHVKKSTLNPENNGSYNIEFFCHGTGIGKIGSQNQRELGALMKFDQMAVRKAVAQMLMIDELPFRFVENEGFRKMMAIACPLFLMPSRIKIARDWLQIYKDEKANLKAFFKKTGQIISITTDAWTSNQKLIYCVITAHFIDDEWILRKRIINFMTSPNHKGDEVGLLMEKCLEDWGINNIFTITVNNATANDRTISYLKNKFVAKKTAVLGGKYIYVRCVAHKINLVVRSGLALHNMSIDRVRNAVKYVKLSVVHVHKFKECAVKEKVSTKKFLALDVATRWNSTFLMLDSDVTFKNVFERYKDEDASVRADFPADGSARAYPTEADWVVASFMANILENFHALTVRVSGSSYVTANIYLDEIGWVNSLLKEWSVSEDVTLKIMAKINSISTGGLSPRRII